MLGTNGEYTSSLKEAFRRKDTSIGSGNKSGRGTTGMFLGATKRRHGRVSSKGISSGES